MPKPVVNIDDVELVHQFGHGDRFEARMAPISNHIGAKKLAYNLTVVPAGRRAFPFHNHHNNEELFFILDGQGTLRFGDQEYPVRPGDVIACPPGGPEVAHQLINTGSEDLRYLALSTTLDTEVVQYPDSGKFGSFAGLEAGKRPHEARFSGFFAEQARLDYWEGE
jgi:uncharacterized cupin superfamily protein